MLEFDPLPWRFRLARCRSPQYCQISLRAADYALPDRARHSAGKDLLDSGRMGDITGTGMVIIDGHVASGRSRNTPPAERVPAVV